MELMCSGCLPANHLPEGQILKAIVDETALIDYPMLSEIRLGDIGEKKP